MEQMVLSRNHNLLKCYTNVKNTSKKCPNIPKKEKKSFRRHFAEHSRVCGMKKAASGRTVLHLLTPECDEMN